MTTASPRLEKTSTPGIYKRGGRYVVRYRDPSGRQRKRFARTLAEARDLKASLVTDVRRGEYRETSRLPFSEYAVQWTETYQGRTSRGIREHTRADYRGLIERDAIPFFGRMRLSEIEPRDVKAYVSQLAARGLEPTSVRKVLAPVRALFATALEEGLIRSNPAAGVRVAMPTRDEDEVDAAKVKALGADDLAAFLDATPDEWRLFFRFLAETGLRIGEAIALAWEHVDFGRRRILVRRRFYRGSFGPPKSRYGRRDVPISAELAQALWDLRKDAAGELVFTSASGQMIDPSNLMTRVLKPAAVEAGLGEWVKAPKSRNGVRAETWVGFHTLRHTCATALFREGLNAKQVQVWLGHHSPSFTLDVYVALLDEDMPESPFGAPKVGHSRATQATETGRDEADAGAAQVAV
jgi:integrase